MNARVLNSGPLGGSERPDDFSRRVGRADLLGLSSPVSNRSLARSRRVASRFGVRNSQLNDPSAANRPCRREWPVASQFTIRNWQWKNQSGFSFVELLVVATILIILASAVLPLAKVTMQRQREAELRRSLREMRAAIDRFKAAADAQQIGSTDLKAGAEGYPADLETLVEGVSVVGDASGRKLKFLRRVPIDPMTNSTDWGLRSYQDRPDTTTWGGQNVFDVYTKSTGTALDGTKYRDW